MAGVSPINVFIYSLVLLGQSICESKSQEKYLLFIIDDFISTGKIEISFLFIVSSEIRIRPLLN
ncbi:hypothetical protein EWX67_11060 [Enterococcus faecalis]|nr:hypothetical protein [Enterococcus faecalis]